jgi:hypothetical protein
MGKKQPTPRQWTIHLTGVYRRERDERIARAFELALPLIVSRPKLNTPKEDPDNEVIPPHGPLRTRL